MLKNHRLILAAIVALTNSACDQSDADPAGHGWDCVDLEAALSMDDACAPADEGLVSLSAESKPIAASRWAVAGALLDAHTFGALPRPTPSDFEPPPVPHSSRVAPTSGSALIDHYRLFYGAVRATTVAVEQGESKLVIRQLWRVENTWQAQDLRDGYPSWSDEEIEAYVGEPIMPDGLYTAVTFTIVESGGMTSVVVAQDGVPELNAPIFSNHWSALYLEPLAAHLSDLEER